MEQKEFFLIQTYCTPLKNQLFFKLQVDISWIPFTSIDISDNQNNNISNNSSYEQWYKKLFSQFY